MKKGIFVSYSTDDSDKKELFKLKIENSKFLYPIIIADYGENMKYLSDKVIEGINRSDYLVPILTEKSKDNQWVNQEIGYAKCKENDKLIIIVPIVEKTLLTNDKLKGFIHNQLDLEYKFSNENDLSNFEACVNKLISKIEDDLSEKDKPIKFTGSRNRFITKGNSLFQFPDIHTRKLFGYAENDIIEYDISEKANFNIEGRFPSIKKVEILKYNQRYYANFNNELKLIPTDLTLEHIQELNKSSISFLQ